MDGWIKIKLQRVLPHETKAGRNLVELQRHI